MFAITVIYLVGVFGLMSLVSELLMWLNSNSGAVQAIATVVLVLVTWRYVKLTRIMVEESRKGKEAPRIQELVNLVMNPIKNMAKSNLEELNKRNYGYNYSRRGIRILKLQSFKPAPSVLVKSFEEDYPAIVKDIERCNKLRDELERAVDILAHRILKIPGFRDACFQMVDEYNRKNPQRKISQSNLEGFPEILIGNIIDRTEHFSERDAFVDFWDKYRDKLIKFLDDDYVKEQLEEVEKITSELIKQLKTVIIELEDEEFKLWKRYGIKIIEEPVI